MAEVRRVALSARLQTTRNGVEYIDHFYATDEQSYTLHAGDIVVLAANMSSPQQASLGDMDASNPGKRLVVIVENISVEGTLEIAVNDSTKLIPVDKVLVIEGTIETLYFKNTDPNNTVTVEFAVTN